MAKERKRPQLWQQGDLGDAWFQQPMLEEALEIARQQEARRKRAATKPELPEARPPLETDPSLDDWFD